MTIAETTLSPNQQAQLAALRKTFASRRSRLCYEHVVIYSVGRLKFVRFEDIDCRPLLLYVWTNKKWVVTPEHN